MKTLTLVCVLFTAGTMPAQSATCSDVATLQAAPTSQARFTKALATHPDPKTKATLQEQFGSKDLSVAFITAKARLAELLLCQNHKTLVVRQSFVDEAPMEILHLMQVNMAARIATMEDSTTREAYEALSSGKGLTLTSARALIESSMEAALAEVQYSIKQHPGVIMMDRHQVYLGGGLYTYALMISQTEGRPEFVPFRDHVRPWAIWWADQRATQRDRDVARGIFEQMAAEGKAIRAPRSIYPKVEADILEIIKSLPRKDAQRVAKDLQTGKMEILFGAQRRYMPGGGVMTKAGQFGVLPARVGDGYVGALIMDPYWFQDPGVSQADRILTVYHEAVRHYDWWKQGNVPIELFLRGPQVEWTWEDLLIRFEDEYQAYRGECELAREMGFEMGSDSFCPSDETDYPASRLVRYLVRWDPTFEGREEQLLEYVGDRK